MSALIKSKKASTGGGTAAPVTVNGISPDSTGDIKLLEQPQFDGSAAVATDAFVQRALGSFSGLAQYTGGMQSIRLTDSGKLILLGAAGQPGGEIYTMPNDTVDAMYVPYPYPSYWSGSGHIVAGVSFTFEALIPVITLSSGNGIFYFSDGSYSAVLTMKKGDTLELSADGSGSWIVAGGSASLDKSGTLAGMLAASAGGIGSGQQWVQDPWYLPAAAPIPTSPSRALNTIYTNATAAPIEVVIGVAYGAAGGGFSNMGELDLLVNGRSAYLLSTSSIPGYSYGFFPVSVIVPSGATYELNMTGADATGQDWVSIYSWSELRA
jgi:hypothetical protein